MTYLADPRLDEALRVFPAWQDIVARVLPGDADPVTVNPRDVYDALAALENSAIERLCHLMIAEGYADSVAEGAALLGRLYALAADGERPRFLGEMGLIS